MTGGHLLPGRQGPSSRTATLREQERQLAEAKARIAQLEAQLHDKEKDVTTPTPLGEQNNRPDLHDPSASPHFNLDEVRPGRQWRHYRGDIYETLGVARESTNGPNEGRPVVVYRNAKSGLCVREASEFLDGRFKPEAA